MSEELAKCPTCEGEGSYWFRNGHRSRRLECAKCQGTGRIAGERGSDAGPRSTAAHGSEFRVVGECPLNFYPGTTELSDGKAHIVTTSPTLTTRDEAERWMLRAEDAVSSSKWTFRVEAGAGTQNDEAERLAESGVQKHKELEAKP